MYYYDYQTGDRFGFVVPFLVGAVTGGAAIGLTRPRPIVNSYPNNNYNPYMPYANSSYSYYYPYYR